MSEGDLGRSRYLVFEKMQYLDKERVSEDEEVADKGRVTVEKATKIETSEKEIWRKDNNSPGLNLDTS